MAPHEAQARKNHGQTLEGLAERGGLGCDEAWVIVHGLSWDALHAEEHKRKWIELAERVNREWSTERLLAAERDRGADAIVELTKKYDALLAAEREKVREMCAAVASDPYIDEIRAFANDPPSTVGEKIAKAIRQLDLTKLDEGGEEKV